MSFKDFSPADLKSLLHSKRANLFYLEHCRVMQKDGRILYLTDEQKEKLYYNIPIANTTVLLLGNGTSITQAAMRMLAQAGVLVGFCGGGGTPLYMASEVEWFTPQSEYRPTEYLQGWLSFWFDDDQRLTTAKALQVARIDYLKRVWSKDRGFKGEDIDIAHQDLENALAAFDKQTKSARSNVDLLTIEARLTKALYKHAANSTRQDNFTRKHQAADKANIFLNHGNYLAYGLAACCLWVLGIPHGFAVMHGKTRRGALVFDVADLIKDALVLPWAFICAKEQMTEQEFRQEILQAFIDHKALDFMFDTVKSLALRNYTSEQIEKQNL